MKYVLVPADVAIFDKRTDKPVLIQPTPEETAKPLVITHEDFVNDNICANNALSKGGGAGIRRLIKLQQAFEGCKPGDLIAIEDADFMVVKGIVDSLEWAPQFARFAGQMLPHLEAWEKGERQDDTWKKKRDTNGAVKVEESQSQKV